MSGKLAVISGFSGAGKGTVIQKLMDRHDGYALSVSMTTRSPRKGEKEGVNYHYVSNEAFEELIRRDGFLEHAGFVDHYYGTPRAFVEENLKEGRDVLLEIEVQGAMQIRAGFPEAVLIFIAPPEAKELERRLTSRGTEDPEIVTKRFSQALRETEYISRYDYLVINDQADACAESLNRIIRGKDAGGSAAREGQISAGGGETITDDEKQRQFAASFHRELEEILADRG